MLKYIVIAALVALAGSAGADPQPVTVELQTDTRDVPDFACAITLVAPKCGQHATCKSGVGELGIAGNRLSLLAKNKTPIPLFEPGDAGSTVTISTSGGNVDVKLTAIDGNTKAEFSELRGHVKTIGGGKAAIRFHCSCSGFLAQSRAGSRPPELVDFAAEPSTADPPDPALAGARDALGSGHQGEEPPPCASPFACPTWFATIDQFQGQPLHVRCARNRLATRPDRQSKKLVAILGLMGNLQPISDLDLEGSMLQVVFTDSDGLDAVSVTSLGGSYSLGLSVPILNASARGLAAQVPLERRCQERSITIPQHAVELSAPQAPPTIAITEDGATIAPPCKAAEFHENRTSVQIPVGEEGRARTLSVSWEVPDQPKKPWTAEASWTSRAPPLELALGWRRFRFTLRRDCVLPDLPGTSSCPAVRIASATCDGSTLDHETCAYTCEANAGASITPPVDLTLSFNDIEWTQRLQVAYETVLGRPPADLRELFMTIPDEDVQDIEIEGFHVNGRIFKADRLPAAETYTWVPMPDLQCRETLSYRFHGTFEQRSVTETLRPHEVLKLAPSKDLLRLTTGLYAGGGIVTNELGARDEGYGVLGADLGRPLSGDTWRLLDGKASFRVGAEVHLTARPYVSIEDQHNHTHHTVPYSRQLGVLAVGVEGMHLCAACTVFSVWFRMAVGRGASLSEDDVQNVGTSDLIVLPSIGFESHLSGAFWLDTVGGLVFGEEIQQYSTNYRGTPISIVDGKTRLYGGLMLKVRL